MGSDLRKKITIIAFVMYDACDKVHKTLCCAQGSRGSRTITKTHKTKVVEKKQLYKDKQETSKVNKKTRNETRISWTQTDRYSYNFIVIENSNNNETIHSIRDSLALKKFPTKQQKNNQILLLRQNHFKQLRMI